VRGDSTNSEYNTMWLFPWAVLATSFVLAAVQAQSAAATPTDTLTASGVNVANVPDCAVSQPILQY